MLKFQQTKHYHSRAQQRKIFFAILHLQRTRRKIVRITQILEYLGGEHDYCYVRYHLQGLELRKMIARSVGDIVVLDGRYLDG